MKYEVVLSKLLGVKYYFQTYLLNSERYKFIVCFKPSFETEEMFTLLKFIFEIFGL